MDPATATPAGALASPSVARNTAPILEVLERVLPTSGRVLEIAAGSGQHAMAFAEAFPATEWTPSDPSAEARASIAAWRASSGLANLMPPVEVDVLARQTWPDGPFDAIVCINMIHISPWTATEDLLTLGGSRLERGGVLYLYGPYREQDRPLAPSNSAFDESLKSRNPDWGLRELQTVVALAATHGLTLTERVEMPANNLSLIFRLD